jgi:WXG100 family type VII secretion target
MSDAQIQVSTREMRAKAGEARDLAAQFRTASQEMFQEGRAIDSCWTGEAKDQFNTRIGNDEVLFEDLVRLIESYCATVETSASEYERAESEVRQQMGNAR